MRTDAEMSAKMGGGGKDPVVREWKAQSRRKAERDREPMTHPRLRASSRSYVYEMSSFVTRWPVDCKAASAARARMVSCACEEEFLPLEAIAVVTSCSERFVALRDKQCSRPTCHRAAQALFGLVAGLIARF